MEKDAITKHSFLKSIGIVIGYMASRHVTFWLNVALIALWLSPKL
jgi:hypothetical protein